MDKVDVVIGIEIEGNKILLTEDMARALFYKLKNIFDRNNITYFPIYELAPQKLGPYYPPYTPWVTTTTDNITVTYSAGSASDVGAVYSLQNTLIPPVTTF